MKRNIKATHSQINTSTAAAVDVVFVVVAVIVVVVVVSHFAAVSALELSDDPE